MYWDQYKVLNEEVSIKHLYQTAGSPTTVTA